MNRQDRSESLAQPGWLSHEVEGAVLHLRLWRSPAAGAPTVMLVNSLGCDLRIWSEVAQLLVPHMHVVTYDKRGHGLSQVGADPHSIARHGADLVELIQMVAGGPAFVCGLSIGGLVAMDAALERPDLVRGLILCATEARIGSRERYQDRIDRIRAKGMAPILDEQMARWFSAAYQRSQPGEVAVMRNMLERQPLDGYLSSVQAIRDADYRDRLGQIAGPVLCLAGEEDGSTPPDRVAALARDIPGAAFAQIEGAGHLPCIEAPGAMARHISRFVQAAQ